MMPSQQGASSRARLGDGRSDSAEPPSRAKNVLITLQDHLRCNRNITSTQPRQVRVVNDGDENVRIVLLLTMELVLRHQAVEASFWCAGRITPSALRSSSLQGSNFRVSNRYRCLADHRGQLQGGIGFVFEGVDLLDGSKVAIKVFHRTNDRAATTRMLTELITCVRLYELLHAPVVNEVDAEDLHHLTRPRDILINVPMLEDNGGAAGLAHTPFRTTAEVFDWADGGDAHAFVRVRGHVTPAEGTMLFQHLVRGLRALHLRGFAHRDVKPENVLLFNEERLACLCDFGFAKEVMNVQPAELMNDPTTCYQPPERWIACHSGPAALVRSIWEPAGYSPDSNNGHGRNIGLGVPRLDEAPSNLCASDVFSAGVTLFMLVGHDAILNRGGSHPVVRGVLGRGESTLPELNIFQRDAGSSMFGLLQTGMKARVQGRLWAYWEAYGLKLPTELRGLLDGVLHPIPSMRFSTSQVLAWIDSHPEMLL